MMSPSHFQLGVLTCLLACLAAIAEQPAHQEKEEEAYLRIAENNKHEDTPTDPNLAMMSVDAKGESAQELLTEDIFSRKLKKLIDTESEIAKKAQHDHPLPGLDMKLAERIKNTFARMDMNKDRSIDHTDLMKMAEPFAGLLNLGRDMKSVGANLAGIAPTNPLKTQEKVFRSFVKDMDANADGKVDFKDYASFMIKMATVENFAAELKAKREQAFLEDLQDAIPALRDLVEKEKARTASFVTQKS